MALTTVDSNIDTITGATIEGGSVLLTGGNITDATTLRYTGTPAGSIPTPALGDKALFLESSAQAFAVKDDGGTVTYIEQPSASPTTGLYGELFLSRESADYSSFSPSTSDYVTITTTGPGTWNQVVGLSSGLSNGVMIGTNALTINTAGLYIINAQLAVSEVGSTSRPLYELAYGIGGTAPPTLSASTQILTAASEDNTNANRPSALVGSRIVSLAASQVLRFYVRWVSNPAGSNDIIWCRANFSVIGV